LKHPVKQLQLIDLRRSFATFHIPKTLPDGFVRIAPNRQVKNYSKPLGAWVYEPKKLTVFKRLRTVKELPKGDQTKTYEELSEMLDTALEELALRAFKGNKRAGMLLITRINKCIETLDHFADDETASILGLAPTARRWPVALTLNPKDVKRALERLKRLKVGSKSAAPTSTGHRVDFATFWTSLAIAAQDACSINRRLVLATDKRAQILNCLVEGCSMRSTARLTGAAKVTIERLLVSAGQACLKYQDHTMRSLQGRVWQVDEVWSFTYAKQKNLPERLKNSRKVGDTWTWIAIDANSKLVPCFRVGKRTAREAYWFIHDLKARLSNRVQLTSDGLNCYLEAVESAFGSEIDYAQLVKLYGNDSPAHGSAPAEIRYSPPPCTGARKTRMIGRPDKSLVSTSFVERQNLTLRMSNRRFTRLTNGYSKKIENHAHMLAIHFMVYNFCRIHHTLRVTPAMEAGISDHVWSLEEIVNLLP
jgi:IS1 family transposase